MLRSELHSIQHCLQLDPENTRLQHTEMELREQLITKGKAAHALMVQQSKATWLTEGDANTNYFHGLLKQRIYQTKIMAITEPDGRVCSNAQEVTHHFLTYYEKLLCTRFIKQGRLKEDVIALGSTLSIQHQAAMI